MTFTLSALKEKRKLSESILKNIPEHVWRMTFTSVHTPIRIL